MLHHPRSALFFASFLGLALLLTSIPSAAQTSDTAHLDWAEDVANNVSPSLNAYESGVRLLQWAGVAGATEYINRTDCTGFLTATLKQAYGYTSDDIDAWIGWANPSAAMYHDTIALQKGFTIVPTVFDIEPGDIIAIKYPVGGGVSGHVMIAASTATLRTSTVPVYAGTYQFEITVVDSSSSGHGNDDTRRQPDGTWVTGAGIGDFRIYADGMGNILGHTWSSVSSSVYRSQATRHIIVGRLN